MNKTEYLINNWDNISDILNAESISALILNNSHLVHADEDKIHIFVKDEKASLVNARYIAKIKGMIERYLGNSVTFIAEVDADSVGMDYE